MIKKGPVGFGDPVDYSYGRLYDEKRIYLNKSGTKFITLGIKPGVEEFKREIRLQSGGLKPFTLLLERCQLVQLYKLIKELPDIHIENSEHADDLIVPDDEDCQKGPVRLLKTSLGDSIFKIIMPDDQFMFFGITSLQKLVDFEVFIFGLYDEMDGCLLKKLFDDFVNSCLDSVYEGRNQDYVIRKKLFQTAMTTWEDRYFYMQTYLHFSDFAITHILALRNK